jgi:hypothetical protein
MESYEAFSNEIGFLYPFYVNLLDHLSRLLDEERKGCRILPRIPETIEINFYYVLRRYR